MKRHTTDFDRNSGPFNPRSHLKFHPYFDRYEDRFIDPYDRDLHPKTAGASHAGKGPKNYIRSDDRIREDACETLTQHPGVDGSDLTVDVSEGVVTLEGTVRERRMKRIAEIAVEAIPGVMDVRNRIRVRRYDDYRTEAEIARRESANQGPG